MGYLPNLIPVLAIVVTAMGLLCALVTNSSRCPIRVYWGRRLFLLIFLLLACACFAMALLWPRGVLPACLAMATLFVSILWTHTSEWEMIENDSE